MASIGRLVNGQFKQAAGNFNILDTDVVTASSTSPGLMSVEDKRKLDSLYNNDNIADATDIKSIFNQ